MNNTELEFKKYVQDQHDQERHTEAAQKAADRFYDEISKEFKDDSKKIEWLWNLFISGAVDFEESGFIAGFKRGEKNK